MVMIHRFALSSLAKKTPKKPLKCKNWTEMSEKVANVHRKTLKDLQSLFKLTNNPKQK